MEKKELKVLIELRKNSRAHYAAIGRKTGMALSSVFETAGRIKGVKKHIALLDFPKLGFPVRIFMALKPKENKKEELAEFLKINHSINTAFRSYNGFDFFIDAIFSDMEKACDFMEKTEALISLKRVYYVTGTAKQEGFLTSKDYITLLP